MTTEVETLPNSTPDEKIHQKDASLNSTATFGFEFGIEAHPMVAKFCASSPTKLTAKKDALLHEIF